MLSTENRLHTFALNLSTFKKMWRWPWPAGGLAPLDWRATSVPRGLWVNLGGLQLAATKLLLEVSRRGGGGAEAAWRTSEAKGPGAMQSSARSTLSPPSYFIIMSAEENPFLQTSTLCTALLPAWNYTYFILMVNTDNIDTTNSFSSLQNKK